MAIRNPHVIAYDRLPTQWAEGLPLGNGGLGVMCWSDGTHLRFTLDSAEAWDLREKGGGLDYSQLTYPKLRKWVEEGDFGAIDEAAKRMGERDPLRPTKVYLGRMDLSVAFDADSELSLHLSDASVVGSLRREETTHALHAFVHKERDLFCLRLDPWPDEAPLSLLPFYETSPGLAELGHPALEIDDTNGLKVAVQHILPDRYVALCWNTEGPEVFVSYAEGDDSSAVVAAAVEGYPSEAGETYDALFDGHCEAWGGFWGGSSVALPERDVEFLWHFGLYVLASCAREGRNPPGLQGLWAMDGRVPPWRGDYHADMNVQETFWSACPANHLELMDVWLDFAYECLPAAEALTRDLFGTEGAFQTCSFLPGYTVLLGGGWHPVAFAWSHTGWLAHLAWLRWRYSMDTDWLGRRGYPIVESAFRFYAANLEEDGDGRFHIPLSSSPEYCGPDPDAWCRDPNIDIALIRKCCDWILEMEEALDVKELSDRAREVHEALVDYHLVSFAPPASYAGSVTRKGPRALGLWADKPLDYSHRHPSHLMAIHPAMDLTIEGSEADREVVEASIAQYLSLGQYFWAGHTYVQMASTAAVVGKSDLAYDCLCSYRDRWILPNGMHLNREIGDRGTSHFAGVPVDLMSEQAPFTINEMCGVSCGISDMLVQGWGDCVRVFPAAPAKWRDLLFVDLLTEGAFTVSGLMRDGQVRWVGIVAGVNRVCRLRDPFEEEG
ncbi:MAG: glycoside hydrolase N-terminal domain-containing protein, partial [Candidatus Latescibacteria bacterium]|nr:glycoside hydrolase N-terminal domain-containing protein [Candidatus Latescibacterota bacterium]